MEPAINLSVSELKLLRVALCNHGAILNNKLVHPNEFISGAEGLSEEMAQLQIVQNKISKMLAEEIIIPIEFGE